MVQRTFYALPSEAPPEGPVWETPSDDVHTLRHGYNLADLDRLTRLSLWRSWGLAVDYRTRYELAWSAVAEALYAADERPAPADLVHAGQDAIATHVRHTMRHHGIARVERGGDEMRGFTAYWNLTVRHSPSPENSVVDRVALYQILPMLTQAERRVLLTVAATGTYQAAARHLGIADKTLKNQIQSARRRFFELWHEHETPSRFWGSDRRVYRVGDDEQVEVSYRKVAKAVRHRKTAAPSKPAEIKHGTPRAYGWHRCRCSICVAWKRVESTQRRRKSGAAVRRQISTSQYADAVRRNEAGAPWAAIAADLGFSSAYLRAIRRGDATPISDDTARERGLL